MAPTAFRDFREADEHEMNALAVRSFREYSSSYSDWPAMAAAYEKMSDLAKTGEIYLDVGTWSRKLSAAFRVFGLGFRAPHTLVVSKHEQGLAVDYPISGPECWQQLVENLAALVAELDKTFVSEIEAAAGPSPAWYKPEA